MANDIRIIPGLGKITYSGTSGSTLNTFVTDLGNISFSGATASNLLFLDGTNSRIGIGTDTPLEKLEVSGNIKANKLLLNTTNNTYTLYANGESRINNIIFQTLSGVDYISKASGNGDLYIRNTVNGYKTYLGSENSVGGFDTYIVTDGANREVTVRANNNDVLTITSGSSVGINTTTPNKQFDVSGDTQIVDGAANLMVDNATYSQIGYGSTNYVRVAGSVTTIRGSILDFMDDTNSRIGRFTDNNNLIISSNASLDATYNSRLVVQGLGTTDNAAISAVYGTTQSILGEVSLIAHRNSQWSSLYVDGSGSSTTNTAFFTGGHPVIFDNSVNVGIGLTNPLVPLHVTGTTRLDGLIESRTINPQLSLVDTAANSGWRFRVLYSHSVERDLLIQHTSGGSYITIKGNNGYVALSSGNSLNPTQRLHVDGNVRFTGAYYDSSNSAGLNGEVLSSTATGTSWVNLNELQGVNGSGTTNYVAKWSDSDTITDSVIYDDGTNVGVGTISPTSKLSVKNGTNSNGDAINVINSNDVSVIELGLNSNHGQILVKNSTGTSNIRIDANSISYFNGGNVGIGATSPSEKLEVFGTIRVLNNTNSNNGGSLYTGAKPLTWFFPSETSSFQRQTIIGNGNTTASPIPKLDNFGTVGVAGIGGNSSGGRKNIGVFGYQTHIQDFNGNTSNTGYGGYFLASGTSITDFNGEYYGLYAEGTIGTATTNVAGGKIYGGKFKATGVSGLTTYGLYVDADNGTNNFAIYSNAGINYFKDNVGIGTTSPENQLDVHGAVSFNRAGTTGDGDRLLFGVNDTSGALGRGIIYVDNNQFIIRYNGQGATRDGLMLSGDNLDRNRIDIFNRNNTGSTAPIVFTTSNADRMYIMNDGKVGINYVANSQQLEVGGNIWSHAGYYYADSGYGLIDASGSSRFIVTNQEAQIWTNNNKVVTIANSGKATFEGEIVTQYGVSFLNGNTDFLLYNNTGEDRLFLRDTTNGQMLVTFNDFNTDTIEFHRNVLVNSIGGDNITLGSLTGTITEGGALVSDGGDVYLGSYDNSGFPVGVVMLHTNNTPSLDVFKIRTNNTDRIVIDADGQVGIGVDPTVNPLKIKTTGNTTGSVAIENLSGGDGLNIGYSYGELGIWGSTDLGSHYNPEKLTFSAANRNTGNSAYIDLYSRYGATTGNRGDINLIAGYSPADSMEGEIRMGVSGATKARLLPSGEFRVGETSFNGSFINVNGGDDDSQTYVFWGRKKFPRIRLTDTSPATDVSFDIWNLGSHLRFGTNAGSTSTASFYITDGNANASDLVVNARLVINNELVDSNGTVGTSGEVLSTTATGVSWVNLNEISGVDGSGTTNYVARWIDSDTIGTGVLYDNGTNVGIGTSTPLDKLDVDGDARIGRYGELYTGVGGGGGRKAWRLFTDGTDKGLFELERDGVTNVRLSGSYITGLGAQHSFVATDNQSHNFGIGTSTPNEKLSVVGNIAAYSGLDNGRTTIFTSENGNMSTNAIGIETDGDTNRTRLFNNGQSTNLEIESLGSSSNIILRPRTGLSVQVNGSGVDYGTGDLAFSISSDYKVRFGGDVWIASAVQNGGDGLTPTLGSEGLLFYSTEHIAAPSGVFQFNHPAVTPSVGDTYTNIRMYGTVENISSNALLYNSFDVRPTINTGQSSGSTTVRGFSFRPIQNSINATTYQAIYLDNSSGYGIYQTNVNVDNYFAGNIGLSTTSPDERIHVRHGGFADTLVKIEGTDGSNVSSGIYTGIGAGGTQGGFALKSARGSSSDLANLPAFASYFTTLTATTLLLGTDSKRRMLFHWNGDIYTYLDDDSTVGMFWDSSEGNFGIGTETPTWKLEVAAPALSESNLLNSSPGGIGIKSVGTSHVAALDFGFYDSNTPSMSTVPQARIGVEFTGEGSKFHFIGSTNYTTGLNRQLITIDEYGDILMHNDDPVIQSLDNQDLKLYAPNTASNVILQANNNQFVVTALDSYTLNPVGIGTDNPTSPLHIATTSGDTVLMIVDTTTVYKKFEVTYDSLYTTQINFGHLGRIEYNGNGGYLTIANLGTSAYNYTRFTHQNGVETMRIDSDGNIGIGTTSPNEKLHIAGNARIEGNILFNNGSRNIQWNGTNTAIFGESSGPMTFRTGDGSTRIAILSNGNVSIGHGNPSALLDVVGESEFNGQVNVVDSALEMSDNYYLRWGTSARMYGNSTNGNLYFQPSGNTTLQLNDTLSTFSTNVSIGSNKITFSNASLPMFSSVRTSTDLDSRWLTDNASFSYTAVNSGTLNIPSGATSNNANGLITINTHVGDYGHQLYFSNEGGLYHRSRETTNIRDWEQLATRSWVTTQLGLQNDLQEVTNNGANTTNSIYMLNSARTFYQNADNTGTYSLINTANSGGANLRFYKNTGSQVEVANFDNNGDFNLLNNLTIGSNTSNLLVQSTYNGNSVIPAGVLISPDGTNNNVTLLTDAGGASGSTVAGITYNGSSWRSMWEYTSVGTGEPNLILVKTAGNVGIGTDSPTEKLHIDGNLLVNSNTKSNRMVVGASPTITPFSISTLEVYQSGSTSSLLIHEDAGTNNAELWFRTGGNDTKIYAPPSSTSLALGINIESINEVFVIDLAGNVGIGTNNPGYPLEVNGQIYAGGNIMTTGIFSIFGGNGTQVGYSGGRAYLYSGGGSALAYWNGSAVTYGLELNNLGNVSILNNLTVNGDISVNGAFLDSSNSPGLSGRVLTSTATGTTWTVISTQATGITISQDILANQTVGGVDPGTAYPAGTSIEDIINNMLVEYIPPVASGLLMRNANANISTSVREVGAEITVNEVQLDITADDPDGNPPSNGSLTASGALTGFTEGISPLTVGSNQNFALSTSYTLSRVTNGNITFTFSSEDKNGDPISNAVRNYSYQSRNVLAASSTIISTINDAQTVYNSEQQDYLLDTNRAWDAVCTIENNDSAKYTYIMYPAAYGDITTIKQDGATTVTGAFTKIGDFAIENINGVSISMRIYRSNNPGAFSSGVVLNIS